MKKIFALFVFAVALNSYAGPKGKVLFVSTNEAFLGSSATPSGIHFNELTHPYYAFTQAGYNVDFATPKGGYSPVDQATLDQADPFNQRFWNDENLKSLLRETKTIASIDSQNYEAIYLVGGVSTMWDFPGNPQLENLIARFYEQGSIVGAVCHGPAALVGVKLANGQYLISGKKISSFTDEEEKLRNRQDIVPFLLETELKKRGGRFFKADAFKFHVISDGNLVTGQNPASAFGVAHEMMQLLDVKKNSGRPARPSKP